MNTPVVFEKSVPSILNDNPVRLELTAISPVETVHVGCAVALADGVAGNAFIVTVDLPVISKLHDVATTVANTLYVVVTEGFTENVISSPVPATAVPSFESLLSKRN